MKKIISLLLVLVIMFCVTACKNNTDNDDNKEYLAETQPIDVETLKANWKEGIITFSNGNNVTLPCTLEEFLKQSELEIYNSSNFENRTLQKNETVTMNAVDAKTSISVKCKNQSNDPQNIMQTMVVKVVVNNTVAGNRGIKFADTLTAGGSRADVEAALGIPKGKTSEDVLYTYEARNSKNKKIELRITFNSDDVVNAVTFDTDK